MRCLPYLLLGGALFAGCGKTVFKSHEGQFCSSDEGQDPFYECTRMFDFVCINTYAVPVQNAGASEVKEQPVWLCRLACDDNSDCRVSGDVCCQGPIYGPNLGVSAACVPRDECNSLPPVDAGPRREGGVAAPPGDGGTGDDGGMADGPAALDGAAPDAGVDAPVMLDAAADSADAS